jgi:general secretion pathway protein B
LQLHFYSRRPKKRLVRLNGENLREGDRSGTGLTIEEIVADGVVLDFRGTRFLYPAGR